MVDMHLNLKLIYFEVLASLFLSESINANRYFLQKFREVNFRVACRIIKRTADFQMSVFMFCALEYLNS